MTCRQVRRLLPDYLENSLTGLESSAFRDHLAACSDCCRKEKELREALDFLRLATPPPSPLFLRESVLRQIERERAAACKLRFALKYSPAAAAAAVFILLLAGNVLLSAWTVPRLAADAPEVQMRTMIQDNVKIQQFQSDPETATPAPPDITAGQEETVQLAAESVDNAGAKAGFPQGRQPGFWRLLLNVPLVPLLIFLMWRVVKKRRVA